MSLITAAIALFVTAILSGRTERFGITAPVMVLGLGVLASALLPENRFATESLLHTVAEVALIILLFTDAAKIDPRNLVTKQLWPVRMLLIGMPLTLLMGIGSGYVLFAGWSFLALALLSAIFAPTDAALSQPVVANKDLPVRVRNSLVIESGLNDGLALPLIVILAMLIGSSTGAGSVDWVPFLLTQLVGAVVVGLLLGCIGGWLLRFAQDRGWAGAEQEGIATLSLAFVTYLVAVQVGANGFVAAFLGGVGFGTLMRGQCKFVLEFTESEGQALSWVAFGLVGFLLVPEAVQHLSLEGLIYILISLFLIRPLAIWISLLGTDCGSASRLFLGWFGPRGLATASFALLILEDVSHALGEEILFLAINALWISAILHGATAVPFTKWLVKRSSKP